MSWSWPLFLWGAVGAAAPEVVKLYLIVTGKSRARLPDFSFAYLVFSCLYVGFGGVFAVAWAEQTAWKCIWIGCSLPIVVSALAYKPPPGITSQEAPQPK